MLAGLRALLASGELGRHNGLPVSIVVTTLLWGDLTNRLVWVVLFVTLAFGIIGWVDDYRKVVHRNPKGLSARAKLFWQSLVGPHEVFASNLYLLLIICHQSSSFLLQLN